MIRLNTTLILLFISFELFAVVYYVNPTAIGQGNGSKLNPFTVSQANNVAVAGDTILVMPGTYNFNTRFTFTNGGTTSNPVVWLAESLLDKPVFTANHNETVDAFTIGDNGIEINGIIFYGQSTATRSVIQVNGDYVSLKNGESHYKAGGSSTDNDNVRGDNIKHFMMQNWLVDGSAWNAINLQTTTNNGTQGLRHLTFDNVEIINILHHNCFNFFPSTGLANPDFIDSITIKNSWVHDNSSGASALLSRHLRKFDIYNNIIEGDLAFASGDATPADTFDVSYSDRKSVIAHNTFIGTGAKQAINNWVSNGLVIKNNAYYGEFSGEYYIRFDLNYETNWTSGVTPAAPLQRHEIDYNFYYQVSTDNEYWSWNKSTISTLSDWQTSNGHDLNAINPSKGSITQGIFENISVHNYLPALGSPLIDAGFNLSSTYSFLAIDRYGGNRGSNPDIGAFEFRSGGNSDITAPELIGAEILDSVTILLEFSEVLEENSAENPSNYSITDQITVLQANLLGNSVRLNTTIHLPGTYGITVSNVQDLSSNTINSNNNAIYEFLNSSSMIQLPVSNTLASVTPEPNHYAEKTIDGKGFYHNDPDSRWAGDTMPEWLVYDIGDVHILNETRLSFFYWNLGRIYNYSIHLSVDSINWVEVRNNVASSSSEWSIENIGPIEARYIKIVFIANNQNAWAGLWEAEFYGHLKLPTNYEEEDLAPVQFTLEQNYPNPFNPATSIQYAIRSNQFVQLKVYDVIGNEIATLVNEYRPAGKYEVEFNAENLASGVYIYRIQTEAFTDTKKMVLLR